MNTFEDPIQFNLRKKNGDVEVIYSDVNEVVQGGPQVGIISINDKRIASHIFGGPCLVNERYVYAPVMIKKFLGIGFKLSRINIKTLQVELLGKTKDLIFLEKISGNKVYFFEDLSKSSSKFYEIEIV